MSIDLSVVLPTHDPHPGRFARTLAGLGAQTLPRERWEAVVVDNASRDACAFDATRGPNMRVVREEKLGLTWARARGFAEARGALVVLVDDDNVLAPDFLTNAVRIADTRPDVGAFGGRSLGEFEKPPAPWTSPFHANLAVVDHGAQPLIGGFGDGARTYPKFAPIGAGMVLRAECAKLWLDAIAHRTGPVVTDRRGSDLASGGDCDIVLTALEAGWKAGYFPELSLAHLIPAARTERDYLARLARGISRSWVQVLDLHGIRPWKPVPPAAVPLLKMRAWLRLRAWSGDAAHVRWQAACGAFEGRSTLR